MTAAIVALSWSEALGWGLFLLLLVFMIAAAYAIDEWHSQMQADDQEDAEWREYLRQIIHAHDSYERQAIDARFKAAWRKNHPEEAAPGAASSQGKTQLPEPQPWEKSLIESYEALEKRGPTSASKSGPATPLEHDGEKESGPCS